MKLLVKPFAMLESLRCRLLGVAWLKRGSFERAEAAFVRATRLEPGRASGHGYRAMALVSLEKWEDALRASERAIELEADTFLFHEVRSRALFELGCWQDTVSACRRAIELHSPTASMHLLLGMACLRMNFLRDAVEAFRESVRVAPDHIEAYGPLARTLVELGEKQEAIDAVRSRMGTPNAKGRLDALFAELGMLDEDAVACLRRQMASDTQASEPRAQLGSHLAATGKWGEAIPVLDSALALEPDSPARHRALGEAYTALHQFERAVECFERALRDFAGFDFEANRDALSSARSCFMGLGNALDELGRRSEATVAFRRELILSFDAATCVSIGRRFQKRRQNELATRAFVRAILMDHGFESAYKVLGAHLEETVDRHAASLVDEQAVAIKIANDEIREGVTPEHRAGE